jgi:hypothetical protein
MTALASSFLYDWTFCFIKTATFSPLFVLKCQVFYTNLPDFQPLDILKVEVGQTDVIRIEPVQIQLQPAEINAYLVSFMILQCSDDIIQKTRVKKIELTFPASLIDNIQS